MMIKDELDQLRHEINDCYFVSCFDMKTSLPIAMASERFVGEEEAISSAFGRILDIIIEGQTSARNETVRAALQRFRELTLETTLSTFIIVLPEPSASAAIVVGVPREVKLGYVRLAINKRWESLKAVFAELA